MPKWASSSRKRRSKVRIASKREDAKTKQRELAIIEESSKKEIDTNTELTIVAKKGETSKVTKKRNKKKMFNSDIILAGIAIGCVLGSVLFYFQGLQPLILENIISQNNEQTDQLYTDFVGKSTALSEFSQTIESVFVAPENEVCTEDLVFNNRIDQLAQLEQLERQLIPNLTLRDAQGFNSFNDPDITASYNTLYADYSELLAEYSLYANDFRNSITFLEYRNVWIETCSELLDNQIPVIATKTSILEDFCEEISTFDLTAESPITQFDSDGDLNDTINSLCDSKAPDSEIIDSELPDSEEEDAEDTDLEPLDSEPLSTLEKEQLFLQGYGDITSTPSNYLTILDDVEESISTIEQDVTQYIRRVESIQSEKTSLTGMWYIVSFDGL